MFVKTSQRILIMQNLQATIRYAELELILSEIGYHIEFVEDTTPWQITENNK